MREAHTDRGIADLASIRVRLSHPCAKRIVLDSEKVSDRTDSKAGARMKWTRPADQPRRIFEPLKWI